MLRRKASVGHTTYTIEHEPGNRFAVISRFNPPQENKPAELAHVYVPDSLIIEFAVARILPRLGRLIVKLGIDPAAVLDLDAFTHDEST
jgi:hypothetical protein